MAKTTSTPRAPRKSKIVAETVLVLNMATSMRTVEDDALSSLLALLDADDEPAAVEEIEEIEAEYAVDDSSEVLIAALPADDAEELSLIADMISAAEVADPVPVVAVAPVELTDDEIMAALSSAESTESMIHAATPEVADGSVTGTWSDLEPAPLVVAVEAKPDAPVKEKIPRKHYTNKADRIIDRLGDKLTEYTVLTVGDAVEAIDEEALNVKMAETMGIIRGLNVKQQNRAGFLMEFVSGKKAQLNEVMARALKILAAEGQITTGEAGNLLANLLARPYSPAAARAMGQNTVGVFQALKLVVKTDKGTYVANPESLLLLKANSLMSLKVTSPTPASEVKAAPVSGVEETEEEAEEEEFAEA